jgi:hypothetical protein
MNDQIVVVSGLPRSGTSLMMKMLEAGGVPLLTDGVREADEDNPEGYYEFEPVKDLERDASWLPRARGRAVKIISQLLPGLPPGHEYRVVFMVRKVEEVVASQRKMLDRLGTAPEDDPGDDEMEGVLLRHLDRVLDRCGEREDMELLPVSFNQIFLRARDHADRVSKFLGGGLDVDAMVAVVDPALYRQRR